MSKTRWIPTSPKKVNFSQVLSQEYDPNNPSNEITSPQKLEEIKLQQVTFFKRFK